MDTRNALGIDNNSGILHPIIHDVDLFSFQKYHPNQILPFISCLNRRPSQIGNSLSYTLHCAERTKVNDFTSVVQPCAESQEGEDLLIESVGRCDQLNTHTSATIRIAGKNVCVRDGGVWKDCREVLHFGGGDVVLGLTKLIDKEWKKGSSRRVPVSLPTKNLTSSYSGKSGDGIEIIFSKTFKDIFGSALCIFDQQRVFFWLWQH